MASSAGEPKITVTPPHCMQDEAVAVVVTGLKPGQQYTLRASVTDGKDVPFHTAVNYKADAAGEIDVTKDAALGGHYSGVFPMGLFGALVPQKTDDKLHRFAFKDTTKPLEFEINVYDGGVATHIALMGLEMLGLKPLSSVQHQRSLQGPGCTREVVKHGRVRGTLHMPPGTGPFPGVIDMFGGAGGLMEHRSALLASRGFATLSLAFFDYEDLPKDMSAFELSYFEEAAKYLLSLDTVHKKGVGAIGSSKGGDLVLTMARYLPEVIAAVCINGCVANVAGTMTLTDGTVIPGLTFDLAKARVVMDGIIDTRDIINDPRDHPDCIIPVEGTPGHLLWLSGLDDRQFPSEYFADMAVERFKKVGREDHIQVLKYPGTGHLIEPSYTPFCGCAADKQIPAGIMRGGSAQPHGDAQVDSWHKMLAFLRTRLTPT